MTRSFSSLIAILLCAGCATGISLTTRGSLVRNVPPNDVPVGCNVLGDVPIGIPPDAARPHSQEELVILMRNKAGELGGNYVIVDSSDHGAGPDGAVYYFGRGRAYSCSEDQINAASHTPNESHDDIPRDTETPPTAGGTSH